MNRLRCKRHWFWPSPRTRVDGLFAFHTSAEDAEYLAAELGGGLDKQDLLELGHYQCYARITDVRNGERLPAFSVRLDAPQATDPALADRLAAESAERYGRNVVDVELDLEAAAERVRAPGAAQQTDQENAASGNSGTGTPSSARTPAGGQVPRPGRAKKSREAGSRPSRANSALERDTGSSARERDEESVA